jgi:hypothetical protein
MCKFLTSGFCKQGPDCSFAHSPEELQSRPDLSCTKLCPKLFGSKGYCNDPKCTYAHAKDELRASERCYKTKGCRFWEAGNCKLGDKCRFAHDDGRQEKGQENDVAPQHDAEEQILICEDAFEYSGNFSSDDDESDLDAGGNWFSSGAGEKDSQSNFSPFDNSQNFCSDDEQEEHLYRNNLSTQEQQHLKRNNISAQQQYLNRNNVSTHQVDPSFLEGTSDSSKYGNGGYDAPYDSSLEQDHGEARDQCKSPTECNQFNPRPDPRTVVPNSGSGMMVVQPVAAVKTQMVPVQLIPLRVLQLQNFSDSFKEYTPNSGFDMSAADFGDSEVGDFDADLEDLDVFGHGGDEHGFIADPLHESDTIHDCIASGNATRIGHSSTRWVDTMDNHDVFSSTAWVQ